MGKILATLGLLGALAGCGQNAEQKEESVEIIPYNGTVAGHQLVRVVLKKDKGGRIVDYFVMGRTFYADAGTRYFDMDRNNNGLIDPRVIRIEDKVIRWERTAENGVQVNYNGFEKERPNEDELVSAVEGAVLDAIRGNLDSY